MRRTGHTKLCSIIALHPCARTPLPSSGGVKMGQPAVIPAEISSQQVVGPKRPNEYVTLSRVFSSATHTQLRMCNLLTAATKFKPNSGKQNFLCSHRVFPRKSSSLSSNVNETFFVVSKSFLTVIKSLLEVQRTKKS